MNVDGRLVEVEAYVDHDAVMDSWERLEAGMALLAQIHNLLRDLEVGEEGRRPRFANHLGSADVASSVRWGAERIRGWEPTPAERRLAALAEELAELVTQAEGELVARLPHQLVHGDFWDNNVGFRGGRNERVVVVDAGRTSWPQHRPADAGDHHPALTSWWVPAQQLGRGCWVRSGLPRRARPAVWDGPGSS